MQTPSRAVFYLSPESCSVAHARNNITTVPYSSAAIPELCPPAPGLAQEAQCGEGLVSAV